VHVDGPLFGHSNGLNRFPDGKTAAGFNVSFRGLKLGSDGGLPLGATPWLVFVRGGLLQKGRESKLLTMGRCILVVG
jgi:hypothetical protein